jgi:hypothetical protein
MSPTEAPEPLSTERAYRLGEFARACKAAARIVVLYPATHPAIQSALNRVTEAGDKLRAEGNAVLTVTPDAVLLEGRAPAKPDSALGELASLLHRHLIGELALQGPLPPTGWHTFLSLLARSSEDIRAEGGIARAWAATGGGPIALRQIDYAEVLRDREGLLATDWDRIVSNYLEGDLSDLDDEAMGALFDIAADPSRFKDFTERLVAQATEGGKRGKKDVVLRILQALADFTARTQPEQLDRILRQIAGVVPQLTPEMVVTLITTGVPMEMSGDGPGIDLAGEVRTRMSDRTVAEFVAHSVSRDHGATDRLAQAFHALVPEPERRAKLLEMAQKEAEHLPVGKQPDFPDLWKSASELITTYSDKKFVSDEYGKELTMARTHAIEVEKVSDDPPERIRAWLSTVNEQHVRKLDEQVLLDLLRIEKRQTAWMGVLQSALGSIDQLVLIGNVAIAQELLEGVIAASEEGQPFAEQARAGLDRLRTGTLMKNVVLVIRQAQESELKPVSAFCRTLGTTVIGPLAEALAAEENPATVRRLREIVLSFGAAGRTYAASLRASANPAVRRTAIELLRAFGGAEALPDLVTLLDDAEPAVQREALRAIVQIGTTEAYATLEQALKSGSARTRDAIMQFVLATRDERAAPLLVYILEHTGYRGALEQVYVAAIDALGKLGGDPESVEALKTVLYRNEWWAPWRTRRLRNAAALSLRATGSELAQGALDEASTDGPREVRRIARAALAAPIRRAPARKSS